MTGVKWLGQWVPTLDTIAGNLFIIEGVNEPTDLPLESRRHT